MGTRYSSRTILNYNASPPSDDGTVSSGNQVAWSKHLDKIGNPLKTLAEGINAQLVTALNTDTRAISASETLTTADHWRTVCVASTVTASITVTLGSASAMANGFIVSVVNQSTLSHTIARTTSSDTINNFTENVTLYPMESITFIVNPSANGYIVLSRTQRPIVSLEGVINFANTSADNTTVLSNVIASLPAVGGAIILPGMAPIGTKLTINKSVLWVCTGLDGHHDVGTFNPTAGFKWNGLAGGTMVEILPTVGTASDQALQGGGVQGEITFDGGALAGKGLITRSNRFGSIEAISFINFPNGADCWTFDVVDAGSGENDIDEAADTQHRTCDQAVFSLYGTSARALVLDGNTVANTSFCSFGQVVVAHTDGDALSLLNCDNIRIGAAHLVRSAGGTGRGVIFGAGATSAEVARANYIELLSTNAEIIAQGTSTGVAAPSYNNVIEYLDTSNGTAYPTVGTGASLSWGTDTGVYSHRGAIGFVAGESEAVVAAARAILAGEALHIRHNSSNHMRLSDTSGTWAVRLAAGVFELLRVSGSGGIKMTASPEITAATITTTATGGAAGALPAVAAYETVVVNGTTYKRPLVLP